MTIDEHVLRDLLCQRLCQDVSIDRRPDGALMLRTQFRFPDGDGFPSTFRKRMLAAFAFRIVATR